MSVLKPKGMVTTPSIGHVHLYNQMVIGTSGAVTSQTAAGVAGFVIALVSTGLYTLTFTDNWDQMVWIDGMLYNAGTAKGQTLELSVKLGGATAKVASVNFVDDAGSAEEPTSGDEWWIHCVMSNTDSGPQVV